MSPEVILRIKRLLPLTLSVFLTLSTPAVFASSIKVHFNQLAGQVYDEPYRKIARNGEDFEKILIEHIQKAQKKIFIAIQEVRLPYLANSLKEAHARGVDVRIVLENSYSKAFPYKNRSELSALDPYSKARYEDYFSFIDINSDNIISDSELAQRDAISILKNAKIPLIDDTADGSAGSGLMHHKFVLIDSDITIVTSANFTWSDFFGDNSRPLTRGNPNNLVIFKDSELQKTFEQEFLLMSKSLKFGLKKPFRPIRYFQIGSSRVGVQFAPSSPSEKVVPFAASALGSVDEILKQSRQKTSLMLFVFSEQKIANTLHQLHKRGSYIEGVFESEFTYQDYSETLDMWGKSMLNRFCKLEVGNSAWSEPLDKEVQIARLAEGDKLHHKAAIIDSEWVVTGSLNWSAAGNHENDETLILIQDPSIATQFQNEFDRISKTAFQGPPVFLDKKIEERKKDCKM